MQGRCASGCQGSAGPLPGQRDCLQAVTGKAREVVRTDGGLAARVVAVERDEDADRAEIAITAERLDLRAGQDSRCATLHHARRKTASAEVSGHQAA